MIYLDNSATTKVLSAAADRAYDMMMNIYANPSSLHKFGLEAEKQMIKAREIVAASINAAPEEIYFTSGGTEANNCAIIGAALANKRRGNRVVTTSVEHASVLATFEHLAKLGFEVVYIKPNSDGKITEDEIKSVITKDTILVSIMHTNNETGEIFPVNCVKNLLLLAGSSGLVHSDCVQAYGKEKLDVERINANLISISGHKIHAPKGVGALYIKNRTKISPILFGGGQEKGMRAGTENISAICAMGEAVAFMCDKDNITANQKKIAELNNYARKLCAHRDYIKINSSNTAAKSILNISINNVLAETLIHYLAGKDIYVSSGSACSSKKGPSQILLEFGLSKKLAYNAIRISFSYENTKEEIDILFSEIDNAYYTLAKKVDER